jgi:hypothetical protein
MVWLVGFFSCRVEAPVGKLNLVAVSYDNSQANHYGRIFLHIISKGKYLSSFSITLSIMDSRSDIPISGNSLIAISPGFTLGRNVTRSHTP